ncbi:MAG: ATP-binding cassette domain-containing protein [Pseudomonadales bacterium]
MSQALVTLQKIHCNLNRDNTILNLCWTLQAGEHWALVGGNGSGKTAVAKIIGHRIPIAQGSIHYHKDIDAKSGVAYVSFEEQQALYEYDQRFDDSELREDAFDPGTSAQQTILQGRPADRHFEEWVERFRLAHVLSRGIRFISSGEMRKVLILRTILEKPRVLILDNPMEGLDRTAKLQVAQLITELMSEQLSIVLLTRRREDILPGITHLALLAQLAISAQGGTADILHSPAFTALFPPLPPLPDNLPEADPMLKIYIPPPGQALVHMENVQVAYGEQTVLDNINFTLNYGDHIAISGPNGCGKSTLLSLMTGDNHKAYGQHIFLFGQRRGSGESVWDIKQKFGIVNNHLHDQYPRGSTAFEAVVSGFYDSVGLYREYGGCEAKTARAWMRALGISELEKKLFNRLSYGQQRMILLARAMVKYPPVLILDEACTGLDEYNRDVFLRMVNVIAQQTNTQILFVSHLPGEIPACINRELVFSPRPDGLYNLIET